MARISIKIVGASGQGINGHLVHAVRSNYLITFVLHNNENFALTTGQASSLTRQGQPMNTSPNGIPERTLPTMDFVFSLEPTFVARGFTGDIKLRLASLDARRTIRPTTLDEW